MNYRIKLQKGVITIPLLMGFMGLILLSTIAIGAVSFNQTDITRISNNGVRALVYAEAGAKDALQRIGKDITYANSSSIDYTMNILDPGGVCPASKNGCADVSVDAGTVSPKVITVIGYSGSAIRKIQVDVIYDTSLKITNIVWSEIKNQPTVLTGGTTSISETEATLTGWTNPNGHTMSVWFRYAQTEPPNCADNFGTKSSNVSPSPGTGTDPESFSQTVSSLIEGATYYYCAIGEANSETVYGQIYSFTTEGTLIGGSLGLPPTVTTGDTTDINDAFGSFRATLNASANPNGFSTEGWFRYYTNDPITCINTGGIRAPLTGGVDLGSGVSSMPYSQDVTGLSAEQAYFVCAFASNSVSTGIGLVTSFTTPDTFPSGLAVAHSAGGERTITIYKDENDGFNTFTKVTDPNETPSSLAYFSDFSNSNDYLALSHQPSPYLTMYKRSGDLFTKLENAIDPLEVPEDRSWGVEFSSDDRYMAVAHYGGSYLTIYKNNGNDTFSKLSGVSSAAASGRGVSFSKGDKYLAVASESFPYVSIYKNNYNDTFTKISNPIEDGADLDEDPDYPPDISTGISFSNSGTYLAISHWDFSNKENYITLYKDIGNDTFSKLDAILLSEQPNGTAWGVEFSNDDSYMAVAHTSPAADKRYISIYKNNGNDTFSKLSDLSPLPTGNGAGVSFSLDDEYLAVAHRNSPYITMYTVNKVNDTFTNINPVDLPTGNGLGAAFTSLSLSPAAPKTFTYVAETNALEAILNGGAMPIGSSTTGWFRYSATNPGTCNVDFGDRAPTSGGTSLGSGTSTVEYSEIISGLTPGTYYFCAISSNANGTTFGEVLEFEILSLL